MPTNSSTPTDRSVPGDGIALHAKVTCPVLICPAGSDELAAKRSAIDLAASRLPDARVTWFEDTMHDIPLQRPGALATELTGLARKAAARG